MDMGDSVYWEWGNENPHVNASDSAVEAFLTPSENPSEEVRVLEVNPYESESVHVHTLGPDQDSQRVSESLPCPQIVRIVSDQVGPQSSTTSSEAFGASFWNVPHVPLETMVEPTPQDPMSVATSKAASPAVRCTHRATTACTCTRAAPS